MCATFEFKKMIFRPSKEVFARAEKGIVKHVWAGFARAEMLEWWQKKGGLLVDIYADRFAERSDKTHQLIWDAVPKQFVIRGLVDHQTAHPLIKIVTRESTHEELNKFQHPRMPVLEPPLFDLLEIELKQSDQEEMF